MRTNHLAESIVHTAVERQFITTLISALYSLISTLHIDAGAEGGAAVGRGAYATLHINGGHAASHISHIHPKDCLALAIVEWHIVECHVDTRVVCAANTEIGIAYS